MVRLILYGIIAFVLLQIFRAVFRSATKRAAPPPPPRTRQAPKQDLSNIQDAEFEDITPKTPPKGGS